MEQFLVRSRGIAALSALLLWALSGYMILFVAQEEKVQGIVQKLFYIHVPAATAMYAAFAIVAIAGGFYLYTGRKTWDRLAASAAEPGIIFATIALLTGCLWGRPIWGTFWVWDARLTSTLILWLIYIAYFIVRQMAEGERGSRFAAVLGIIGAVDIPFIMVAAEKFATMHPNDVRRGGLTREMGITLTVSTIAGLALFVYLMSLRLKVAKTHDEVQAMTSQLEDPA